MMLPSENPEFLWKMIFEDGEVVYFGKDLEGPTYIVKSIRDPRFIELAILQAPDILYGYVNYMRMSGYLN